jgi:4-hydroxy-2-oxoheptanedioate aldolase
MMNAEDARRVRDITKFAPVGKRRWMVATTTQFTRVGFLDISSATAKRFACYQDRRSRGARIRRHRRDGRGRLPVLRPGRLLGGPGIPGQIQHPTSRRSAGALRKVAQARQDRCHVVSRELHRGGVDMGYNSVVGRRRRSPPANYADESMAAFDKALG